MLLPIRRLQQHDLHSVSTWIAAAVLAMPNARMLDFCRHALGRAREAAQQLHGFVPLGVWPRMAAVTVTNSETELQRRK